MSVPAKTTLDKSCFVCVSAPGTSSAESQYVCSLCHPIDRSVSMSYRSRNSHLSAKAHLAAVEQRRHHKGLEGPGEKVRSLLDRPPTTYKPKPKLLPDIIPSRRVLSITPSPERAPASNTSSNSSGSSVPVALDGEAEFEARKKESDRKRADLNDRKRREARKEATEAAMKDSEPRRKKAGGDKKAGGETKGECEKKAEGGKKVGGLGCKKECQAYIDCRLKAEELVKAHIVSKKEAGCDWQHVERVRRMALDIGETIPGADPKIIELLAIFHGLASVIDLKAELAPFQNLKAISTALTLNQVSIIMLFIPSVSWDLDIMRQASTDAAAHQDMCVELHAVQDAAKLDRMGVIGFARCVASSVMEGRMLFEDGGSEGRESAEAQFKFQALVIKGGMKTEAGKTKAQERLETAQKWLEALQAEKRGRTQKIKLVN